MATVQLDRPLTYDDLAQMPDDLNRYELINGELVVSPAPSLAHQLVLAELFKVMSAYVDQTGLGKLLFAPVDVRLTPYNIVEPDLLFIRQDRFDRYQQRGMIDGPPDLVVEVLSPSSQKTDMVTKAALYASAGVPEYWLIDPDRRTVRIQVLHGGIYQDIAPVDGCLHSTVIEGLVIDATALFVDLDH